MMIDSSLQRVV